MNKITVNRILLTTNRFFIFLFIVTLSSFLNAQISIKNQIIVKVEDVKDYYYDLASLNGLYGNLEIETISNDLDLYLLKFDLPIDEFGFNFIKNMNSTRFISYNMELEERRIPNDPSYGNQWYLNFINAPKVWDYTTGGKTKEGEDIVIAILDTGIQTNHSDLEGNIFVNTFEIPGNGIDDDNNGYRDDVNGINVKSNNGTHAVLSHGTWVAGVAGAKGNNSLGITGVNWDVKILPITEVTNVAALLKGYDYLLNMRKAYNQSGGSRGALIVAANYSGGLKNRFGTEAEFRPWCEMYNLLGAQGILSVGSVANSSFDVDIDGDMPTTCESEFLITVTSINQQSNLFERAAYGKKNVDIAAPGVDIFGLTNNNKFFTDFGTSASAPMVAGVIGLLYSADCSNLDNLIKDNPRSLALSLKNAILNGVNKTSSLEDVTTSGGYLDAFKAYVNLQGLCENQILDPAIKGDLAIKFSSQMGNEILVNYVTPDEQSIEFILSNALGQIVRKGNIVPPQYGDKTFTVDISDLPTAILHLSLFRNKEKVTSTIFISSK